MSDDFVALDVVRADPLRGEIAAVMHVGGVTTRLLGHLGYDTIAVHALNLAADGVEHVVIDQPATFAQVIVERAGDAPWVSFDLAVELAAWATEDTTGALAALPQADVGDLACLALPHLGGRELGPLLAAAELPATRPARGMGTAQAVADLWLALPGVIAKLPEAVRAGVRDLLVQARHPLAAAWAAGHAQGAIDDGPRFIESLLRERLKELTPAAAEPGELPETQPIDLAEVRSWFAPDGQLAACLGAYEDRPGQVEMAVAVATALNTGQCLLVEAGTGTGKSIAYLAPALRFATANHTPVVVSTNTKNLQDQLRGKDLPLLARALPFAFRAEMIKGRGNYLCVEKLLRELGESRLVLFEDQLWHLACLLTWVAVTNSGDLDDLSSYLTWRHPRLESYARTLASDSETCTAHSARHHPCFATVARRRAALADLLVVNHALALANTTVEVLPPFGHVIFDEAHNLEDIATEAFGLDIDRRGLLALAREVSASRDTRTFANRTRRCLENVPADTAADSLAALTGVEQAAAEVAEAVDDLAEQLAGLVLQRLGRSVEQLQRSERLRLDASVWDGALGRSLRTAADNLLARLTAVTQALGQVTHALLACGADGVTLGGAEAAELPNLRVAAQARFTEWSEAGRSLSTILELDNDAFVYWLEFALRREQWEWRLRAAPIEAGEELAEHVWRPQAAAVLTSATLTVAGRFDYFAHRLGLQSEGVRERYTNLRVPSSFDYRRQVLLGLPANIAAPHDERFEAHVARAVDELARLLDGRTLVLFTAIGQMKRVYEAVAPRLEAMGLEPLCQGVSGSRHALAERFRTNEHSVLFGTRSFWEGIDVPGDALRCVVIVKLPFSVPEDPVQAARCERIRTRGGDPWRDYSLPQAVILFKQGFGRLIRTATDRGAVIVLDRRVHEKSYGQAFLSSVPGYREVFGAWGEIKERVSQWFEPAAAGQGRVS